MLGLVFVVCLISWASAQNERGVTQEHSGHGWDIRLAVPGEPGSDYPTLGAIPRTTFSCAGREPGYYADVETGCQVFRVCTVGSTYGFQSFLCPNGTLFNQAVFVCDWWMNVKCQESQRLFKNNNEQFENLRLGPQLLTDIKKMLTHPMRNPYDRNSMRSNLIVMQEYKPPTGQLFPNGALLAGPERQSSKVYMPSKQVKQNLIHNSNSYTDNRFIPTTSDPKYIPAAFSTVPSTTGTAEVFQRQRGDARFIQSPQIPQTNIVSNGHARQFTPAKITDYSNNNNNFNTQLPRPTQNYNIVNQQRQTSITGTTTQSGLHNGQKEQIATQHSQYVDNRKPSQLNSGKQTDFGITRKQNNFSPNQNVPAYTYRPPLAQNFRDIPGDVPDDIKQNVVSTIISTLPTAATRPAALAKNLQEPKPNKPRSRVTVKTWLVKPTKAARLMASPSTYTFNRPSPTAYTYNRPTISTTEKLTENSTPYVYNAPTAETITEIDDEIESTPYYYSRPTVSSKQIITTTTTQELARLYLNPSQTTPSPRPTFSTRFSNPVSMSDPINTLDQVFIRPSSTQELASRYYLPPVNSPFISRQYLPPRLIQQLPYQTAQIRTTPTAPSPVYVSTNVNQIRPSYTITKQSRINTNNNNLSFADILTKEKLDITVNDIVKDTNSILRTASPENFGQYREIVKVSNYPEDSYVPTTTANSGEILTSQSPITSSKSSRLISLPANHLIPPVVTTPTQSSNKLSFLPYFQESLLPAPNTIERTVSLKITIPEKIAAYLFKNTNDSDFDRLEIMNTGASNYLILSNNLLTSTNPSFIPIGKLVGNKDRNISNSQALVFSLLADSINAAKEYTNIAQQESLSTTLTPPPLTTPQFPTVNNGDLSQITNKISQLTSSQYSGTNFNSPNIVPTPQTTTTNLANQFESNIISNHQQSQSQPIPLAPYNIAPPRQNQEQFYSPQQQTEDNVRKANLVTNGNENEIYSGQLYQLPVLEVTDQIYNRPELARLIQSNDIQQQNVENSQQANKNITTSNSPKQSSTEVEVIQSETLPLNPAKLPLEPSKEPKSYSSDETLKNLLNSDNGISAHLRDKIIGTIPHPLEENKLVTYENEKSYYLFSKVDNLSIQESKSNALTQLNGYNNNIQTAPGPTNGFPNSLAFQFLPSIGYQLEDEKDQQKLLNTFQIDEFGAPKEVVKANLVQNDNEKDNIVTSNVDYSIDHSTTVKDDNHFNEVTTLYNGPSSYLAPQSSIGSLGERQVNQQNNINSRLETLDNSEGYPKERPARQFTF